MSIIKKYLLSIVVVVYSTITTYGQIDFLRLEKLLDSKQYSEVNTWSDSLLNKAGQSKSYDLELKLFNAIVFKESGNKDRAAEIMYSSLQEAEALQDKRLIGLYNYYLAISYYNDANYGSEYLVAALSSFNKQSPYYPLTIKSMADQHLMKARYIEDEKLKETFCDSSFILYNRALKSMQHNIDSVLQSKIYRNISSMRLLNGALKSAFLYCDSAILFTPKNDAEALAFNQINLGNLYYKKEEFNNAIKAYKQGLAHNGEHNEDYRNRDVYSNIGYAFRELSQYDSASHYFLLSTKSYDSFLSNVFTERDAVEAEKSLLISKFEGEITEQEELAEKRRKRFQWLLGGALLLSLLFLYIYYTQKRNEQLKQQNYELRLKSAEMQKEKELAEKEEAMMDEIIDAGLEAKEQERREISEMLHNGVAAMLSSANLHLAALKKYEITDLPELKKAKSLILDAGNQVRRLSHSLVSPVLIKFGLHKAVVDLADLISNDQIRFKVDSNVKSERLPVEFESKIYLIVKELCQNVIKHSQASEAFITLNLKDETLQFSVNDNGVGMGKKGDRLNSKMGLGIGQIISVARAMKGTIDIQSSVKGTQILIELPLPASHLQEQDVPPALQ